jgi:hypothetical protein
MSDQAKEEFVVNLDVFIAAENLLEAERVAHSVCVAVMRISDVTNVNVDTVEEA